MYIKMIKIQKTEVPNTVHKTQYNTVINNKLKYPST